MMLFNCVKNNIFLKFLRCFIVLFIDVSTSYEQGFMAKCKVTLTVPVIFTAVRVKMSNTPLLEKLRDKT